MPEKTVKRRPQDCDAALAFDDGLSSSTVAKVVDAIQGAISVMLLQIEIRTQASRIRSNSRRRSRIRWLA